MTARNASPERYATPARTRSVLVPEYWRFCSEAQYRGVRHRGCDFGNLAGRSFMQIAKARGWTGTVVYFDTVTAFTAMLWALVCHQSSRDHPTSDALMASGFSAEEVATMSRDALHAPASEIVLQSLHLRRLLSECCVQHMGGDTGSAGSGSYANGLQGWGTSGGSCFWNAHAPHSSACTGSHG